MDGYQELKLIGSIENQERLFADIERSLTSKWKRRQDIEDDDKKIRKFCSRCFVLSDPAYEADVTLRFVKDRNDHYYVSTVTLRKIGHRALSISEQNSVLERFYKTFIEGKGDNFNVRVNITGRDQSPEKMMAGELLAKFEIWKARIHGTHTADLEAQYDFIIQAHKEGSLIDSDRIRDYLEGVVIESEAWEASLFYEQGRALLKRFDDTQSEA